MVVEAAAAGTDTVSTEMATFSLELIANVENLTYTGIDADPFVGTGNALNNVISGGDLNDTLSGLAGNDTLKAASARIRSPAATATTISWAATTTTH